jgi:hypothetical protein
LDKIDIPFKSILRILKLLMKFNQRIISGGKDNVEYKKGAPSLKKETLMATKICRNNPAMALYLRNHPIKWAILSAPIVLKLA